MLPCAAVYEIERIGTVDGVDSSLSDYDRPVPLLRINSAGSTQILKNGFHFIPMVMLVLFAGCTKFDLLNATIPHGGSIRYADVPYGSLPRQKLDVYRPRGVAPGATIVVFFYGGDWQNGSKGDYFFAAQALTSQGFIAVLPDYRLYPNVTFPAFVDDGAMAVRWVHDHAEQIGGNPRHVYLMGHSAGAHIVALLTLDDAYLRNVGLSRAAVRASVGLSGPYDFVPPPADRAVFGMSRASTQPDPDIEPIHFVDGAAPPMLLIQGQSDTTVYPSNSINLAARINAAGGAVKLLLYPRVDHVGVVLALAWPFRWIAPTLRDATAYIRAQDRIDRTTTRP
jgi:acetyl esterase/lipase